MGCKKSRLPGVASSVWSVAAKFIADKGQREDGIVGLPLPASWQPDGRHSWDSLREPGRDPEPSAAPEAGPPLPPQEGSVLASLPFVPDPSRTPTVLRCEAGDAAFPHLAWSLPRTYPVLYLRISQYSSYASDCNPTQSS